MGGGVRKNGEGILFTIRSEKMKIAISNSELFSSNSLHIFLVQIDDPYSSVAENQGITLLNTLIKM